MNSPVANQDHDNGNSATKRPLLSLKKSDRPAKKVLIDKAIDLLPKDDKYYPVSNEGIMLLIQPILNQAVHSINGETGFELSDDVVISPLDSNADDDDRRRYGGHKKSFNDYLQFYTQYHRCFDLNGNRINIKELFELYGDETKGLKSFEMDGDKTVTFKDVTRLTIHNGFFALKKYANKTIPLRQIVKSETETDCGIKFIQIWNGQEIPSQDEDTHSFLRSIYDELIEWYLEEKDFDKVLTAEDAARLIVIASESKNEYHSLAAQLMIALGKSN